MSPAWRMWSTPANSSKTRGSTYPWVSEITPIVVIAIPVPRQTCAPSARRAGAAH